MEPARAQVGVCRIGGASAGAHKVVADVSTRFGVDAGCKLGKAKYYCEPAHKDVFTSSRPFFPVVGRGLLDSRICYGLKCRNEAAAGFGGWRVSISYGSRSMSACCGRDGTRWRLGNT